MKDKLYNVFQVTHVPFEQKTIRINGKKMCASFIIGNILLVQ